MALMHILYCVYDIQHFLVPVIYISVVFTQLGLVLFISVIEMYRTEVYTQSNAILFILSPEYSLLMEKNW